MNASESTVEVFWMAFQSLSREEQNQFYGKLLNDKEFLEDFDDILVSYQRRNEPTTSLDDVVKELNEISD